MNFRRTLLLTTSILISSVIHGYSSNLSSGVQNATSSITGVQTASVTSINASALSSSIGGYLNAPVVAQSLKSVSGSAYSIVNTFYTNLQKALQSPSAQSISASNLTNLNNALASFQQALMGVIASYTQNYQTSTITNYLTTFLSTGSSGFINNISNGTSVDSSASTIVSRLGSLTPYLQQKVPASFTSVSNAIDQSTASITDPNLKTAWISFLSPIAKQAMTMSSADLTSLMTPLQSLQSWLNQLTSNGISLSAANALYTQLISALNSGATSSLSPTVKVTQILSTIAFAGTNFLTAQITSLSPDTISKWTQGDVQAAKISGWLPEQVQALSAAQIAAIPKDVLVYFNSMQVMALTPSQIAVFTGPQILTALELPFFKSIAPALMNSLTVSKIQTLSASDISIINNLGLSAFSPDQQKAIQARKATLGVK